MRSDHTATATSADGARACSRALLGLLRPHARTLVIGLAMLLGLSLVNMALPAFIALLFNEVFPNHAWNVLWAILGGIVVVYVARNVLYFKSKFTAVSVGEQVCFNLRKKLFERLQAQNLEFYRRHRPGEVSSRVMDDTYVVQTFIQDELPKLLQSACLFIGLIIVLYAVNWKLALASTLVLPLHLYAFRRFKRPIKDSSRRAAQQLAVVHGNFIEKFLGVEVVKGSGAEERETRSFVSAIDASRQSQLLTKKHHVTQKIVADLLVGLGTVGLLGLGGYEVMRDSPDAMRPGTFVAFFGYVGMLYPTVLEMMSGFAKYTSTSASVDRVMDLINSTPAPEASINFDADPIEGRIEFESVSFGFDGCGRLLKNVSFQVPAGAVCAITGPSGGGKSTLVNFVPRFLDPDIGRVMIDGMDVREYDTHRLRDAIGVAGQECFLFNASIFENLRYARPDASPQQIIDAARRLGADEFIDRLPDGYATVIGEGGVQLSRGQKQLLALTRALLKSPRVLILDEATASLDSAAIERVLPEVFEMMAGRTTLMVTHRPQLLRHADVVIYLEEGRVIYQGPYDQMPPSLQSDEIDPMFDHPAAAADSPPRDPTVRRRWSPLRMLLAGAMIGLAASATFAQPAEPPAADAAPPAAPATEPTEPAAPVVPEPPALLPADSFGGFVAVAGLNQLELDELLDVVTTRVQLRLGYHSGVSPTMMPPAPATLHRLATLSRVSDRGTHLMQVGYQMYRSQPPHLWVAGRLISPQGNIEPNPDMRAVGELIVESQTARDQVIADLRVGDLATRKIALSYVESARCLQMLQVFGFTTVAPGAAVDPTKLPAIVAMPPTAAHQSVGGPDPNKAPTSDFPLTDADPISELLVFYHPAKPEQFSRVLEKIRTSIDVPARQIMIEAMVLEISETGLERLGIQWELDSPGGHFDDVRLGRLPSFNAALDEEPTLRLNIRDIFGEFRMKLDALVREGTAKILSRPSVLTLDNRMAYINVAERIPVVTSLQNPKSDIVVVNFQEVVAGIQLNVRPRVAADSDEISMQVVASVTSRVPNGDVVVRNSLGDEVARSPTISAREVKTYTRIANNTPFIIGGLIATDELADIDKVPLLGDLPLIGVLFQAKRANNLKREVIIVLTPYVLPEARVVGRNLPKDEDAFDSFGNQLFRDAYRIRAEDVYDLTFLSSNRYLRRMEFLGNLAISRNFRLGEQYPFDRIRDNRVPGEEILIYRQMYEVIKRRKIDEVVDPTRIIFFHPDDRWEAGFSVTFLHRYLAEQAGVPADAKALDNAFAALQKQGKALAMTYTVTDEHNRRPVLAQPVPDIRLVDCPDDQAWADMLWKMNQPAEDGTQRYTLLIRTADDLTRLRRAIMVKRTVLLNAQEQNLTLANFTIGRLLLMPSLKVDDIHLIDSETARYFYLTEHYYPALAKALDEGMDALYKALQSPDVRPLLGEEALPDPQKLELPPRPLE